jgi:hypothetical protein
MGAANGSRVGIPFDTYAKLVGVSRQTLYRWRDMKARLQATAER